MIKRRAFIILSKDKGYDPLIEHLNNKRGLKVQRVQDLAEIPVSRAESENNINEEISSPKVPDVVIEHPVGSPASIEEKILFIVVKLISRGRSRPQTVKQLQTVIHTLFTARFTKKLEDQELPRIISLLQQQEYIQIENGKVTYNL